MMEEAPWHSLRSILHNDSQKVLRIRQLDFKYIAEDSEDWSIRQNSRLEIIDKVTYIACKHRWKSHNIDEVVMHTLNSLGRPEMKWNNIDQWNKEKLYYLIAIFFRCSSPIFRSSCYWRTSGKKLLIFFSSTQFCLGGLIFLTLTAKVCL